MPSRPKLVVLISGERLEYRDEDARGIHTDAGIHPISEVLGLRVWCESLERWVSIPIN